MQPQVVLLAEDRIFELLRKSGDLPARFLGGEEGLIVQRDPWKYIPPPERRVDRAGGAAGESDSIGPTPELLAHQERERDELFAGLLGSQMCQLLVLGDGERSIAGDIERSLEWYAVFEEELQARLGKRALELNHTLIVVCTADVSEESLESINKLVDRDIRLHVSGNRVNQSRGCYLMMSKLELGARSVLHSHHVWPIYVSRLLVHLAQVDSRSKTERHALSAWRTFTIVPHTDAEEVETVSASVFQMASERLITADSDEIDLLGKARSGVVKTPELGDPEMLEGVHDDWMIYRGKLNADIVAAPARWDAVMRESGDVLRVEVGNKKLGAHARLLRGTHGAVGTAALARGVQDVWNDVREHPKAAASRVKVPEAAGVLGQWRTGWDEVVAAERAHKNAVEEASDCAGEFESARLAFVPLRFRIVFALVVSLFIFYLGYYTVDALTKVSGGLGANTSAPLFPSAWSPYVAGFCGVFGAFVAVGVQWFLQRKRGIASKAGLLDQFRQADDAARERHRVSVKLVLEALDSWRDLRGRTISKNLERLLKRIQIVLPNEFQLRSGQSRSVTTNDKIDEGDELTTEGVVAKEQRLRQLKRAREVTALGLGEASMTLAAADIENHILALADKVESEFLKKWRRFLIRHDPELRGNIPVGRLADLAAQFCDEFRVVIQNEVAENQMEFYEPKELWLGISEQLAKRNLHDHGFRYYASCPLPEGTASERLIYIHDEWAEKIRQHAVGRETIVGLNSDLVPGIFGYVFETQAIKLKAENGRVVCAKVRRGGRQ